MFTGHMVRSGSCGVFRVVWCVQDGDRSQALAQMTSQFLRFSDLLAVCFLFASVFSGDFLLHFLSFCRLSGDFRLSLVSSPVILRSDLSGVRHQSVWTHYFRYQLAF